MRGPSLLPGTTSTRSEAGRAGDLMREANILPDVLYTSMLSRAIQTANLALDTADRLWIPVKRSWRLNERHYGALQGLDKAETLAKYGNDQFMTWRRSFDTPPPPIDDDNEFSQAQDPRYAGIDSDIPKTECLKDVVARVVPFWQDVLVPLLSEGKNVLVVAHGTDYIEEMLHALRA